MVTLEIVFKISEIAISIVGLILVALGLVLPFRQSLKITQINQRNHFEQQKKIWEIQLLNEQISKYYGPISAILKEQTTIRQRICYQIGRNIIFDDGKNRLCDLSSDEQLIWKHFVDKYKIPMQNRIIEIMRDNAHLAVHGEHDAYVDQFLEYALGWELLDNQKREGVPNHYEYYYSYSYPKAFSDYINITLTKLLKEKESLIHPPETSGNKI